MPPFKANNPGCECCEGPEPIQCGTINVNVRGCDAAAGVAGAIVTLKLGGTILDTCVTPSNGLCSFPIEASGSYTVEVVPPAGSGYAAPASQTFANVCTGATISTRTFNLVADAAHVCCIQATCKRPLPKTLTLSDGTASVTSLNWASGFNWYGCRSCTATHDPGRTGRLFNGIGNCSVGASAASISTPIGYQFSCTGGSMLLNVFGLGCAGAASTLVAGSCGSWNPGSSFTPNPGITFATTGTMFSALTAILASCDPLACSVTQSLAGTGAQALGYMIWGGSVTWTITE